VAGGCQIRYRKGEVKRSDTHFDSDGVAKGFPENIAILSCV
jgi:hypothetical protein